jgi:hypothetical protein
MRFVPVIRPSFSIKNPSSAICAGLQQNPIPESIKEPEMQKQVPGRKRSSGLENKMELSRQYSRAHPWGFKFVWG